MVGDSITNHAVVRFLERHDRFDMAGLRDAFAGDEERILRWLERNEGINVRKIPRAHDDAGSADGLGLGRLRRSHGPCSARDR